MTTATRQSYRPFPVDIAMQCAGLVVSRAGIDDPPVRLGRGELPFGGRSLGHLDPGHRQALISGRDDRAVEPVANDPRPCRNRQYQHGRVQG
ncbi:hypothetical protein C357_12966 [Citreicella sp. 357]|nr:hypothetical protein C357_12966 [Citreicella sp. 357]